MATQDVKALARYLRIDLEALRAGVEALSNRQDTASLDKELIALAALAESAMVTLDALETAIRAP
jgi:hypothetical protein